MDYLKGRITIWLHGGDYAGHVESKRGKHVRLVRMKEIEKNRTKIIQKRVK